MSTFLVKYSDDTMEYPLAAINIRKRYPNTSFPKVMSDYSNPDMGIYQFVRTDPPESRLTHDPVEDLPRLEDGKYIQQWKAGKPKPQEEIEKQFEMTLVRVKQHASDLILAKYPDWKQRNMTMRVVTLNATSPLTDEEQAELVEISVAWDWIDAIRAASDTLEQEMKAMGLADAVVFNVREWSGWQV